MLLNLTAEERFGIINDCLKENGLKDYFFESFLKAIAQNMTAPRKKI
jgi:hypothetical protein